MNVELKHTWTLSRNSWIIRFYLWAWGASPYQITFCKLFWGYVLAPVALLARPGALIVRPFVWCYDQARAVGAKRERQRAIGTQDDVPGQVSEFFARERPRRISKYVGFTLLVPLGLAVAGGLLWLLYMLVTQWLADGVYWFFHTDAWLTTLTAIAIAVFWVGGYAVGKRLERRRDRKHEVGEVTIGDVFTEGAKAVKSNTCPRIEVR